MTRRILLVSGWAHPRETLQPLAALLANGAGVTTWSCADLAARPSGLRGVLDEEPSDVVVVGWSMGGTVALEAALHSASRLAGLVLIASTARFCTAEGYDCGTEPHVLRAMRQALRRDPEKTVRAFLETCARPDGGRGCAEPCPVRLPELEAGLNYLAQTDLRDRLADLTLPVLLLHGMSDEVVPWRASLFLSERLSRSRMVLWPNRGHDVPVRNPVAVAAEIRGFLEEVCAG